MTENPLTYDLAVNKRRCCMPQGRGTGKGIRGKCKSSLADVRDRANICELYRARPDDWRWIRPLARVPTRYNPFLSPLPPSSPSCPCPCQRSGCVSPGSIVSISRGAAVCTQGATSAYYCVIVTSAMKLTRYPQ
jgi:hypothetical protein